MPVKVIQTPTGQEFKMGRKRPIARGMKLSMANYLKLGMPLPPPACNYRDAAEVALANVYGNDTLGDCVIAGIAHLIGVFTGNSGEPVLFTLPQIIKLYSAIGGYVPGDESTDNGCDEETALNYWENNGFPDGENKVSGIISVNPNEPRIYRTALWLFENLFFGCELPDEWITPFPSGNGFKWGVAGPANPDNGHCFIGCAYKEEGIIIDSWGMFGVVTDAAIQYYMNQNQGGQMFCVISPEIIKKAILKAPSGFDWTQLVADFDSLGGNVSALIGSS
jgi:hypothetical protein